MQSRHIGDRHFIALQRGDEIMSSLEEYCLKNNIQTASISGIGAVSEITVGAYNMQTKTFANQTYRGNYEVSSLLGNISILDGKAIAHLHIVISDAQGQCIGGHLQSGIISVTGELVLDVCNTPIVRQFDEETQRHLWAL